MPLPAITESLGVALGNVAAFRIKGAHLLREHRAPGVKSGLLFPQAFGIGASQKTDGNRFNFTGILRARFLGASCGRVEYHEQGAQEDNCSSDVFLSYT